MLWQCRLVGGGGGGSGGGVGGGVVLWVCVGSLVCVSSFSFV